MKHLNTLQEWSLSNEPNKDMLFYNGYWNQITFIRDDINYILFDNNAFTKGKEKITVINTHTSKSIKLPVYLIDLTDDYGIKLLLRNNFYDWKISVESNFPIECDFLNIFKETKDINDLYCEGFPKDKVFQMYKTNNIKFTIELYNNFELYTFMWILKEYLLNIKK